MDIIEQKFTNFKAFLAAELPDSWMLSLVTSVPAAVFLKGLHGQDGDCDQVTDKVLELAGLSRDDFTADSVDKFKRYIEYFQSVAAQIYGECD